MTDDHEPANPDRSRWTPPWWPFFVYMALLLGGMLLYGRGRMEEQLPHQVGWAFVPPFLYLAFWSVVSGTAPAKFVDVDRKSQPLAYWLLVAMFIGLAGAMAAMGFGAFAR